MLPQVAKTCRNSNELSTPTAYHNHVANDSFNSCDYLSSLVRMARGEVSKLLTIGFDPGPHSWNLSLKSPLVFAPTNHGLRTMAYGSQSSRRDTFVGNVVHSSLNWPIEWTLTFSKLRRKGLADPVSAQPTTTSVTSGTWALINIPKNAGGNARDASHECAILQEKPKPRMWLTSRTTA